MRALCLGTVEPRYNEVLVTMKITLLYQVSHYIRVKKNIYIKSWDQQNYIVIRGFCYIRPLYNEVPLYMQSPGIYAPISPRPGSNHDKCLFQIAFHSTTHGNIKDIVYKQCFYLKKKSELHSPTCYQCL